MVSSVRFSIDIGRAEFSPAGSPGNRASSPDLMTVIILRIRMLFRYQFVKRDPDFTVSAEDVNQHRRYVSVDFLHHTLK